MLITNLDVSVRPNLVLHFTPPPPPLLPLGTRRKLNGLEVFWLFLCTFLLRPEIIPGLLSLHCLTLRNSTLIKDSRSKNKSHRKAEGAKFITYLHGFCSLKLMKVHANLCNYTIGWKNMFLLYIPIWYPFEHIPMNIILKLIKTKSH